jgi:hypothetical protein
MHLGRGGSDRAAPKTARVPPCRGCGFQFRACLAHDVHLHRFDDGGVAVASAEAAAVAVAGCSGWVAGGAAVRRGLQRKRQRHRHAASSNSRSRAPCRRAGRRGGRRGWQLRARADPPPCWRRRREVAGRQGPSGAPAAGPTASSRLRSSMAAPQAWPARLQWGAASAFAAAAPNPAIAACWARAKLKGEPEGYSGLRKTSLLQRATHCASQSRCSSSANTGGLQVSAGAPWTRGTCEPGSMGGRVGY